MTYQELIDTLAAVSGIEKSDEYIEIEGHVGPVLTQASDLSEGQYSEGPYLDGRAEITVPMLTTLVIRLWRDRMALQREVARLRHKE